MDKPLLTFIVMAYNQERIIHEAIKGALSQTYSPLEIVLSDDCSPDRTFEIMQEMVADYQGPHTIVLNRNETNQGICGHVNRVLELAQGELIVMSAGDDISLPHRTQKLYEVWEESGRKAMSIFSNVYMMNFNGEVFGPKYHKPVKVLKSVKQAISSNNCFVLGASHAFSRRLFTEFGSISPGIIHEDLVIPFRALLADGISYLDDCLVKYRVPAPSVKPNPFVSNYHQTILDRFSLASKEKIGIWEQWKLDIMQSGHIETEALRCHIDEHIGRYIVIKRCCILVLKSNLFITAGIVVCTSLRYRHLSPVVFYLLECMHRVFMKFNRNSRQFV
ncbi:MAG: glycosyltransferase [bacterium]